MSKVCASKSLHVTVCRAEPHSVEICAIFEAETDETLRRKRAMRTNEPVIQAITKKGGEESFRRPFGEYR